MLDPKAIPEHIRGDLNSRGHTDEDIAKMTPKEAFNEFCSWNGLIGWGNRLWFAMEAFKGSEVEQPEQPEQAS